MTQIKKSIHSVEARFDQKGERFAYHHPYLSFFAIFTVMPLLIFAAVFLSTMVIMMPIAWICGWL